MLEIFPIMLALCLMLFHAYYAGIYNRHKNGRAILTLYIQLSHYLDWLGIYYIQWNLS